ncbi:MAG: hypothetical protein KKA84_08290 [Bacteroidetes bacterium]|nr:hypothetical protein [Bacteroidota bacterium]
MSNLNLEITLYHTPYHDDLMTELQSIINQKKSIYRNVNSAAEVHKKLSYEEREFLKHLTSQEDQIFLKLIEHKGWRVNIPKESPQKGKITLN